MKDLPKIGSLAPDFTLSDQNGTEHSLSDYQGQWVLLYFYPKDDTPGCTVEACTLRDNLPSFDKLNAKVLGVSTDTVKSHEKFAQKFGLNFTLLADENKEVVELYDVWRKKKMMGREYMGIVRWSFLINPKGKIVRVYENVTPAEHAEEVLADIEKLS